MSRRRAGSSGFLQKLSSPAGPRRLGGGRSAKLRTCGRQGGGLGRCFGCGGDADHELDRTEDHVRRATRRGPSRHRRLGDRPPGPGAGRQTRRAPVTRGKAIAAWRTVCRLERDEVVNRVAPPFIPERMADAESRFPLLRENRERRGFLLTLIDCEKGGTVQNPLMNFGAPDAKGRQPARTSSRRPASTS